MGYFPPFFSCELAISLSGLKNARASGTHASSAVFPGKSKKAWHKEQLGNNCAKSHRKWHRDHLGSSACPGCGFPGLNKLAKLHLFDKHMSILLLGNQQQYVGFAMEAKGGDGVGISECARLGFASRRNSNPFTACSPCISLMEALTHSDNQVLQILKVEDKSS